MADEGISDGAFPAADVDEVLSPARNKYFNVDPISSQVDQDIKKERAEAASRKKKCREEKEAMQTLKTTIIVAGVILAVAGAAFAITKKLKEK